MASLSCGYKCLLVMLVLFNTIMMLLGIGLIIVGSIAMHNLRTYLVGGDKTLFGFVIFVIVLGCYMTLIAIFGCCGAFRKSTCCLMTFIVGTAIFLLVGIAGGIAGFVLKDKVENYVTDVLNAAYIQYQSVEYYKKAIDTIQKELKCCGPNGDWNTAWGNEPSSCSGNQGKGCVKASKEILQKYILIVALCVFLFALIQIFSLVFAICVYQALRQGDDA